MRHILFAAVLAAGGLIVSQASAQSDAAGTPESPQLGDHQAGIPLAPTDAAGSWTLESSGRTICVVKLSDRKAGGSVFGVDVPSGCGDALPRGVAGWTPTNDGMSLVAQDGSPVVRFNRWSNSLLVAYRSSGLNIQLRRGASHPQATAGP